MDENQTGLQGSDENRVELARSTLAEIMVRMGFQLVVHGAVEDDRIVLRLEGDEAAQLIGRKGQTLDALQFLLNRILNRQRRDHRPVVVDAGGYRQRRADALQELAERLGEKAARTGKTVAVNPMSAHDRRIIHMALREVPGVTTRSEGEGESRRLLIVPVPK